MTSGSIRLSKKILVFFLSIVTILSSQGCLDSPESLGSIPKLVIYHPEEETRVFVISHGGNTMYDSINITIENDTSSKNMSYCLEVQTSSPSFELEITILLGDYIYRFSGHLTITEETKDEDTTWRLTFEDHLHHNKTIEEKLPYKQLLESVE